MPEERPDHREVEEADAEEQLSGDALDEDGLRMRGDVDGLLALAKAYRSGTAPGGRNMKRCLDVYRVAAELGSADAEYAVALFCMTGGVAKQDLKEGATRLRVAAERGSVPAKVYIGNLYELGIHYKADPEKADVWYRNAARGARVEAEVDSPEYLRELAELGCARYVLALAERGTEPEAERTRLLQRARAHGYGLRLKDETAQGRPALGSSPITDADVRSPLNVSLEALSASDVGPTPRGPVGAKPTAAPRAPASAKPAPAPSTKPAPTSEPPARPDAAAQPRSLKARPDAAGPSRVSNALGAFGYALLFAIAGVGAGYAATLGARELVAHGTLLPVLGTQAHLVFPIVLALLGVLPTWLVYRLETVLKALVIGAFFGSIGWVAWGTGQAAFHALRQVQAMTFGLSGFLAALLVLGLLGGAKKQGKSARRPGG